jgi:hypothetical protein
MQVHESGMFECEPHQAHLSTMSACVCMWLLMNKLFMY